ncbi:MAG: FAD-dependent oxidoreductase [Sphingomonadaceae bacterium]|nr:FAD-dependent oxidoreductase [Sphingomonadaceae bacterium]
MRGSSIWRALERARAMNLAAEGAPPAARGGSADITRRRVLAALAGGVGLATWPRWPAFAQGMSGVAIVGGGLAGLGALDVLRSHRVPATLYEARAAVGGRTRSVRGVFAPDFAFDEGAQLVNTDHADMLAMIRRFRLTRVDREAFGPSREIQIARSGAIVPEARLAAALRGIAARITADADRLDADYAGAARDLDRFTVKAYLDRHGLRPGDARDALEAGIRTEFGSEPDEVSAMELIFNLPTVRGQRLNRLSKSDERYLISGGTDQVARALGAEHQADIRLNKRLTAVEIGADAVRLAFADGERVTAARAILALPPTTLREVRIEGPLPPLWRAFIDEAQLGRNEKVIVGYDQPVWRRTMGFGGGLWAAGEFAEVWEAQSLAPRPGPAALCYFLGGRQVDAAASVDTAELARRFTVAARRALPELPTPNGRLRRTRWAEDPLTRGAYSRFRPGQLTRFASLFAVETEGQPPRAPQAGPLLFAGEHLSDSFAGFMNGALQSGRIAAEALLAQRVNLAA